MIDRVLTLTERSSKVELAVDDKLSRRKKQALAKKERVERKQFLRQRKEARRSNVTTKTPKDVVKMTARDRSRARHVKRAGPIKTAIEEEMLTLLDEWHDDIWMFELSCTCNSYTCIHCSIFNCRCNKSCCIECSAFNPDGCDSDNDLPIQSVDKSTAHERSCFWFDENQMPWLEENDDVNCATCSDIRS
jgi:hypothetical protein